MASPPQAPPPPPPTSDTYAGYTRFELELEFTTLLSSPLYLNHLASLKLLSHPPFIAYLRYLQYWTRPEYIRYLRYPGPTSRALELLQGEGFREAVLGVGVVGALVEGWVEGGGER